MARFYFLKADTRKSFLYFSLVVFGLFVLMGSSCNPKQDAPKVPSNSTTEKPVSLEVQGSQFLDPFVDSICHGDFEQARKLLQQAPNQPVADQMKQLVDHYFQIQKQREQVRQDAHEEQLKELEKIKERFKEGQTPEPNDFDETMLVVFQAREYAKDDQKEALLEDPFVKQMIIQMKAVAEDDEHQGKWLDAYAHCYYWLSELFEDDKAYKDKADELIELSVDLVSCLIKSNSFGKEVLVLLFFF